VGNVNWEGNGTEDSEGLSSNSGKPNPKILWVTTDKQQSMAPFLRYVTLDPIHCIWHRCRNPRRLVAVATKFSTMAPYRCSMSPYWHLEFWCCSWTFGKSVHPCTTFQELATRSCYGN